MTRYLYSQKILPSIHFLLIFLFAAGFSLFSNDNCYGISNSDYLYRVPPKTNDGWETASLHKTGVDSKKIYELIYKVQNGTYKNIHSVLLVKDGKLILEEYFHGFHREKIHQIRSAAKSIGSILIGMAIDDHFIRDVDEKIYPFFKEYEVGKKWDERVKNVTLKTLLTMTSGYACDDHVFPSFQCERAMYKTNDWLEYALDLPMAYKPGEHWAYNSSSLIIVSEIISKTSKLTVPRFADKYLFNPLRIKKFRWGFSPKGRVFIAGNAKMIPRDMAKIGYLMLNNGRWKNQQIISQKWIKLSTRNHVKSITHRGYGYLWWTGKHVFGEQIIKGYWAAGNGGNYIFVCPELNLVAVFTGGNYNSILEVQPLGMLINYIIPAMLPPISPRRTIKPDPMTLDSYVGEYQMGHIRILVINRHNNLFLELLGKSIRLFPEKTDLFFASDDVLGGLKIIFKRNDKLFVNSAIAHTNFQILPFKKVK